MAGHTEESTVRAFIALEIPEAVRGSLLRLQQQLRAGGLRARWVRPENVHLTVRFLGDIPLGVIPPVCSALEGAADGLKAPELQVANLGVFPNLRRARVIWAGLGGQVDGLNKIKARVDACLQTVDRRLFPIENRRFRAHLTLGRFRKPVEEGLAAALKEPAGDDPLPFFAKTLALLRSELKPGGPVYTPLGRWTLQGAGQGH